MDSFRPFVAAGLAWTLSACSLVFPAHPDSDSRNEEKVSLTYTPSDQRLEQPANIASEGTLGAESIIPLVAGYAIDFLGAELEKEKDRYEASFGASICLVATEGKVDDKRATGLGSSGRPEDSSKVGRLVLERLVGTESAARFEFVFDNQATAGGAFRVTLDKLQLKRTRAKVLDGSWSRGWYTRLLLYGFLADVGALLRDSYGDEALDINISMVVEVDVLPDKGGAIEKRRIGSLEWVLQNQPFGSTTAERLIKSDGGWLALPSSAKGTPITITVTVEEADEFGALVGKASQILKKNREKIVQQTRPK